MNKLLIVVDMQHDFTFGALKNLEAISVIPKVLKKVNEFEGEVIYSLDTHTEDYLNTQEGKYLPVIHCVEGTKGHNLVEPLLDVQKVMGSKTYNKPTFGSVKLAEDIAKWHTETPIDEIELCGVCTDICVISNAMLLKAFVPEVKITVDASCSAGVSVESHLNALEAMKMVQINIINE